jgi:hypothetical protein
MLLGTTKLSTSNRTSSAFPNLRRRSACRVSQHVGCTEPRDGLLALSLPDGPDEQIIQNNWAHQIEMVLVRDGRDD